MREEFDNFKKKVAVVILAYSDFESLELSLAVHSKFLPDDGSKALPPIFILQNGRGTYDCERTYRVAKRYHDLYPDYIHVVDDIQPQKPYFAIKQLFECDRFKDFEYVIKLDDDVFPLRENWVDELCRCYIDSFEKYGQSLAYVTSLVNNNPWGFNKTLEIMGLREEFGDKLSRKHIVGISPDEQLSPFRVLDKGDICTGGGGSIWRYPYIARWIHEKTTLRPDEYIAATDNAGYEVINSKERYSINCMLFKKEFWNNIQYNSLDDDEKMCQLYCIRNNAIIVANKNIPMCHLFFYTQRDENKDMMDVFVPFYQQWIGKPYPIRIFASKERELESRLAFLEQNIRERCVPIKYRIRSLFIRLKQKILKVHKKYL